MNERNANRKMAWWDIPLASADHQRSVARRDGTGRYSHVARRLRLLALLREDEYDIPEPGTADWYEENEREFIGFITDEDSREWEEWYRRNGPEDSDYTTRRDWWIIQRREEHDRWWDDYNYDAYEGALSEYMYSEEYRLSYLYDEPGVGYCGYCHRDISLGFGQPIHDCAEMRLWLRDAPKARISQFSCRCLKRDCRNHGSMYGPRLRADYATDNLDYEDESRGIRQDELMSPDTNDKMVNQFERREREDWKITHDWTDSISRRNHGRGWKPHSLRQRDRTDVMLAATRREKAKQKKIERIYKSFSYARYDQTTYILRFKPAPVQYWRYRQGAQKDYNFLIWRDAKGNLIPKAKRERYWLCGYSGLISEIKPPVVRRHDRAPEYWPEKYDYDLEAARKAHRRWVRANVDQRVLTGRVCYKDPFGTWLNIGYGNLVYKETKGTR